MTRLPMAQVESLQRLHHEPGLRVNDLAARHRLASNTGSVLVEQMVLADQVTRTPDRPTVGAVLTKPHRRRPADLARLATGPRVPFGPRWTG